ncbi:aromatic ring-hydroxylating oxygenase subunit alpha [Sorangium atrum]|uniref:cholesterol 7-desaturase n=1 Tax=Sorangium atrum TaxID=2995308 RepID=A0ABT5CFA8_9BACT|nr:aromatic ring-hydroxylating dioxygenase subunit alpha [Sorangium aterium]MDC0685085.1 aromatic ring-hydroxylating dioxygenase subunit alpha [Sorangium aterium]
MTQRFPFSPYPTGWYRVAYTDELRVGQVVPLQYFGKALVLFRTTDGRAHVLDAHCPHLGAHLGIGGTVVGETIRCPFHGWRFDGSGRCSHDVPCAKVPGWTVEEINGVIFAYHDVHGKAPSWHVPPHPELHSADWTRMRVIGRWRVRTHVQELNENGVDLAHYTVVHGVAFERTLDDSVETDGPLLTFRMTPRYRQKILSSFLPAARGSLEIRYYGLGTAYARVHVESVVKVAFTVMTLLTPIDDDHVDIHMTMSMRKLWSPLATRWMFSQLSRQSVAALTEDVPILENKIYRSAPLYGKGDGQIARFRRWATQFYAETENERKAVADGER